MAETKIRYMSCCGTKELVMVGYTAPEDLIRRLVFNYRFAHVFFTDVSGKYRSKGRSPSGWALAAYIKKHKLGKVVMSETRINPNSGNALTAWIWTVSKTNLNKWKGIR